MIILALDVGTKRIGMAASDPLEIIATGVGVLERRDLGWDLEEIQKVVQERKAGMILLGLPIHMNGSQGREADEILKFRDDLGKKTGLPIDVIDERWTTVAAEKTLLEANLSRKKRKGKIDQVAAQIILQTYLERKRTNS